MSISTLSILLITLFVFGYLVVALLRPEKF